MADEVYVDVVGMRRVEIHFDEFPKHVHDRLKDAIESYTEILYARIEEATPSRTGKLRSQERARVFADNPNRVAGYIDIDAEKGSGAFAKAAALEYGAHNSTKVSSHAMRLDHYWSDRLAAPTTVLVGAYTRTANIVAQRFMRDPTAEMQPQITAALHAAVEEAEVEANE